MRKPKPHYEACACPQCQAWHVEQYHQQPPDGVRRPHPYYEGCSCYECRRHGQALTAAKLDAHYRHMIIADDPQSAPNPMIAEKREAVREWFDNLDGKPVKLRVGEADTNLWIEDKEHLSYMAIVQPPREDAAPSLRRERAYSLPEDLLVHVLSGRLGLEADMPHDAVVTRVGYDIRLGGLVVIVQSEQFDEVEEGAEAPPGPPYMVRELRGDEKSR